MISGLSVILITRNEEHDLAACLESVRSFAAEIVVVDSGSTDRTLEIARRFTDKVFSKEWTGFSAQKQFALEKATGPWVLNIDADERLTPELGQEISETLSGDTIEANGFSIPFHTFFLGRRLRFGGVGGETHVRLFRKGKASYGEERVHEGIQVEPPLGRLTAPIDHTSYRNIEEYLRKCNFYTSLLAQKKFAHGVRFHWWRHLRLPFEFASRYVFKGGFLDGEAGFVYAVLSSYYVWLKFLKLKDLEKNS